MTKQELLDRARELEEDAKGLFLTHKATLIAIVVVACIAGFIGGKIF